MRRIELVVIYCLLLSTAISSPRAVLAAEETSDQAELAKKSLNPIAAMISLPIQFNYDASIGPFDEGEKIVVNVQPVIPISISDGWNLISRTIIPIIDQKDILPLGLADESGIGDISQSLFFSPKKPTSRGWIWGAGPVMLFPTASDELLGGEKWGLGPTAVALRQAHGFTYGALANHIWSVAGDDGRADISTTFLQPFLSYTTKTFTSFGINTESSYNWETEEWSMPVNFTITQLLKIGPQPVSLQAGARYWADSPDNGPEDWGFRFSITFLFPR
jgi:hypothetical protein